MLNYKLELPIEPKDAKRRSLKNDLAKLLIGIDKTTGNKEDIYAKFAELIYSFCEPNQIVLMQPIRSFSSLKDYKMALDKYNVVYRFDSEYVQAKTTNPKVLTIECSQGKEVAEMFKVIQAEAIVFFPAQSGETNLSLEKKVSRSSSLYYENAYMEEIEKYGVFTFFAESHMTLELLGLQSAILKCLVKSLKFEGRIPPN
jgi:hypothetical protein